MASIGKYLHSSIHRKLSFVTIKRTFVSIRADSTPKNDVLFEELGNKGVTTLNRPQALNALNLSMVEQIHSTLKNWESKNDLVLIRGAGGKAFCAGGDIKSFAFGAPNAEIGKKFTEAFCPLIVRINKYKTPYIALISEITLGGGDGLSIHGKYRIATEKTMFAMPETAIGHIPDAGSYYFLPKLQGKLGLFMALTGYQLKGADTLHAGIATHYVPSEKLELVIENLLKSKNKTIDEILDEYKTVDIKFSLESDMEKINKHFSKPSLLDIMQSLQSDDSERSKTVLKTLSKMSPTALRLAFESQKRGENSSLEECLNTEFGAMGADARPNNDFAEGVRALLIDKDGKPNWNPKRIEEVDEDLI